MAINRVELILPVTVEELRNLSDAEVIKRINDKIAAKLDGPILKLEDFAAAQFYMAELDRREKQRADKDR